MPTTYCTLHKNILTSLQNKEFYRNTHSHFHCLPALYRNTHSHVHCQKHKRTCQMLTCTLQKHKTHAYCYPALNRNTYSHANCHFTLYRNKHSHAHCYPAFYRNIHFHVPCMVYSTKTHSHLPSAKRHSSQ